ncbi:hypothetical protein BDN71DRAFT_1486818 [Pleurotus eryngii]|uniref:Peroxisomal membrane protein PEX14 n=1 Tax=Pleurotus eryngii TaxID=5323 RepID=A0A9P6A5Q0_PLEER|nr:hypothetical protein BDN71DRAFT_1486818 [Pleurotus eryngii]
MSSREELVRNAVAFLVDPKSQASPLAQRIQFLEAKGLTPSEIDIAVRQASLNSSGSQPTAGLPVYGPNYGHALVPPRPVWDWRDYFITAVVSGTIMYGASALFKKYLLPHLQPPSSTAYEEDRDAMTAQFDAAEQLLKEIQTETSAIRTAVEKQQEDIDKTTQEVNAVVKEMREGEVKTRDEMREVRDEMNTIREMLPKMIDKNRETQTQSLAELQQELKSLKALLLSRGPGISIPTTPTTSLAGKPSIPAWQLSGSTDTVARTTTPSIPAWQLASSTTSTPSVAPASATDTTESALLNLRKSLASNRSGSPGPPGRPKSPAVATSVSDGAIRPAKSRLEERLRASFTVGDISSRGSTKNSTRATPSPAPASDPPEDIPTTIPLPDSLPVSPLVASEQPSISESLHLTGSKLSEQAQDPLEVSAESTTEERYTEADIPLPDNAEGSHESADTELNEEDVLPPHPEEPLAKSPPLTGIPELQPTVLKERLEPSPPPSHLDPTSDSVSPPPEAETPSNDSAVEPHTLDATIRVATGDVELPSEERTSAEKTPHQVNGHVIQHSSSTDDVIQEQLRQLERRFADVTESFKKLQSEKDAADNLVRTLTPLEGLKDLDTFKDYLQSLILKVEISEDDIKRLNGKLSRQSDRIDELRDTHRLESHSQSDQIERLHKQVAETEALLKASHDAAAQAESENINTRAELASLKKELERTRGLAKEEEEKRVKAISLLKTVRQKLVKAEKDRDEARGELAAVKEREKGGRDKEEAERSRLQKEIDSVNAERERAVTGLKGQFDEEIAGVKERYEREISALKGQFELEAISTKSGYSKEIASKDSQISTLEKSVNALSNDKNNLFEQMQLRQAESESLQSHLESLQSQNAELQFQLREANDRLALLSENLAEARHEQDAKAQAPLASSEEVARLLSATQSKYETKLADMRKDLLATEKERNDAEADWSRKLREKTREADELKRVLASSAKIREESQATVDDLASQIDQLKQEIQQYKRQVVELQHQATSGSDQENIFKDTINELKSKVLVLEHNAEENSKRETHLKATNKTLREELRKVQSSAALLERQRHPGVGYWSRQDSSSTESRTSVSSETPSRTASPAPSQSKSDEEVNLEYLRNVILQFLEHKEMRPNLVKVLSIILHFTPQETRRLIAKV